MELGRQDRVGGRIGVQENYEQEDQAAGKLV